MMDSHGPVFFRCGPIKALLADVRSITVDVPEMQKAPKASAVSLWEQVGV
jgi:hypothetical protein